ERALGVMGNREILPPGQHPFDPSRQDIDPIGFALERLQTLLIWIDEHRSSFEQLRHSDPGAENELDCLKNASKQAVLHLQRLTELLLAGYAIDPHKHLPKELCGEVWLRLVQVIRQEHSKGPEK